MSPEVAARRVRRSPRLGQQKSADVPPVTSLRLHFMCVTTALLAASVFTLTEHDDHHHSFWCMFEIILQSLLVIAATVILRARAARFSRSPAITPMLVMVVALSLICEPIRRLLMGEGHSFEMLVMHSQCNLMLALAACGLRMSFQRLAVFIGVFITIFCCTISSSAGAIPVVGMFALSALVWLVIVWWESVDRRILQSTERQVPGFQLVAWTLLPVTLLLCAGGVGVARNTVALEGFLPGSGGTGEYDPFSRGGVNDGDAVVAGSENVRSFAAIEDAPFVESEQPGLYDVFNETFDDPAMPVKRQDRAIALPSQLMLDIHRQMAEARKSGQEFSLTRKDQTSGSGNVNDLETNALFFLSGRTPAHLRMEVFELFDGRSWMVATETPVMANPTLKKMDGRNWLTVPVAGRGFDMFRGRVSRQLKTAGLGGNLIPTPPHLEGVNIPLVDQASMYRVHQNGLVSLDRNSIPPMTPVNLVSRCVDRDTQMAGGLSAPRLPGQPQAALPAGDDMNRIRALAEQLTAGLSRGVEQIAAIESYVRRNHELDRSQRMSAEVESPVAEFLFGTRRGPEYLFASSAAVLLRSLEYPARIVGGFYARPQKWV